jgi:hypothetical protein
MTVETGPEVQPAIIKGIAAAAGAAIVVGLAYGLVGMFVNEFKWLALATGAASGVAAVTFAKKHSLALGTLAAAFTLVGMIVGKLLIRPEGVDWIAYHTTMFDIMFCFVGAPVLAFIAAGTQGGDYVRSYLPFNR